MCGIAGKVGSARVSEAEILRMCDAIAHPVARLRRVRLGPISDARLRPGQFRDLTEGEIRALTTRVVPRG